MTTETPNPSEQPPKAEASSTSESRRSETTGSRSIPFQSPWLHSVAAARPVGLILLIVGGFCLTWITFLIVNRIFEVTSFSHLHQFRELTERDHQEVLRAALGKNPDDAFELSELYRQITIRTFSGAYNEHIPPDQQVEIQEGVSAPKSEEEDPHPNTLTIVWWNASSGGETATDEPNPQTDPGEETPAIRLAYVLQIKRTHSGGTLSLAAEYFPIVDSKRYRAPNRSEFAVLNRPAFWCQLRPCAVRRGVGELAARFPEQMRTDLAGHDEEPIKSAVLKDRKQKEQVVRYIEEVLKRQFGRETAESASLDEIAPFRDYQTLEDLTFLPRIVNGSDSLGFIQFFTVLAFWMMGLQALFRGLVVSSSRRYLDDTTIFPQLDEVLNRRLAKSRTLLIQKECHAFESATHSQSPCPPLEVAYAGYSAFVGAHGSYDAVPSFVESEVNILNDQMATGQWLLRYLIWLIPSIGFIGTVIGIGAALMGTGAVLADNPLEQQAAIQSIAQKLGTAFDTTFVALILSILGMFFLHLVQKSEEKLVQDSADKTLTALIDPQRVRRSPWSKLHRAINRLSRSAPVAVGGFPAPKPSTKTLRPSLRTMDVSEAQYARNRPALDFLGIVITACAAVILLAYLKGGESSTLAGMIQEFILSFNPFSVEN